MRSVKKFFNISILFLILSFVPIGLSSCNNNNICDIGTASVSVIFEYGSKSLSLSESMSNMEFRYCAVRPPYQSVPDESTWEIFSVNNSTGLISNLMPGSYNIYINAYYDNQKVLYGQGSVFLESGKANSVVINLEESSTLFIGKLFFDFTGNCDSVLVSVCKPDGSDKKTVSITFSGSGEKRFTGTADNLTQGIWIATVVFFKNNIEVGGETVAVNISPRSVATVIGSLNSGLSELTGNNIKTTPSRKIKVGQSENFIYSSNGGDCRYAWYLDDNPQPVSTSASYTFKSVTGGNHTVKCVVNNDNNNSYTCNVTSYYKERVELQITDLVAALENTDIVCSGFKVTSTGEVLVYDYNAPYYYAVEYATFDTLTDCSQAGLTPIIPSQSDYPNVELLIIGSKANLTSDSTHGWFGQSIARKSMSKLRYVWCNKNVDPYAFYGCANINEVHTFFGSNVTSVGAYGLGNTGLTTVKLPNTKSQVTYDANAFNR